jgi:hypothetical protein
LFNHSNSDIINYCQRVLFVLAPSGIVLKRQYKALPMYELCLFCDYFAQFIGLENLKEALKNIRDEKSLFAFLVNNIKIEKLKIENSTEILETSPLILYFNFLHENRKILFVRKNRKHKKREIKPLEKCFLYPVNAIDFLFTIFEQNNLINFLKVLLEKDFTTKPNYFDSDFFHYQILKIKRFIPELNKLPLNLTNMDYFLTWEQKNYYIDLIEQENKNKAIYANLATSVAISNSFSDKKSKLEIHKILFANKESSVNKEEIKEINLRHKLLKDKFTGDREEDNKSLIGMLRNNNTLKNSVSLLFTESELMEYCLL